VNVTVGTYTATLSAGAVGSAAPTEVGAYCGGFPHSMFFDNFGNFTIKFRKDLYRKLELKQTPFLKYVAVLPCEK